MIVCPDYDKFEFTKTDLELVDVYGRNCNTSYAMHKVTT